MGGSGSTRRVVVEDVDGGGVVKISDSVVKRIRGQEGNDRGAGGAGDAPPARPRAPPAAKAPSSSTSSSSSSSSGRDQPAAQDVDSYYLQKLRHLEEKNSELQKITNEQFVKAVQEVEQKFLKHSCMPVCQDLQAKVYECYLGNPNQTLNCSAQVRAFTSCVERARQNALLRKG